MKLVQDTAQGLGQAATKMTTSVEKAVNTVQGLSTSLPSFIQERVSTTQTRLQAVGEQLLQLPQSVDPAPVVASLNAGAAQARELMSGFIRELDQLPATVHSFVAKAQPVIDQSTALLHDHAKVVESARGKASALVAAQPSPSDMPAAVRLWWEQAARALPVVDAYAAKAATGRSLEELQAFHVQTKDTLQALQADVLRACAEFRGKVQLEGASTGEGQASNGEESAAAGSVARQSSLSRLTTAGAALDDAGIRQLQAEVERIRQLVPDISGKALQPLVKARSELDSVSARLGQAGVAVQASLETALVPIGEIPPKLSQVVVALSEVLTAFKDTLGEVRKLIGNLIDRAMQVVAKLDGLPALFGTVRSSIDAAVAQIAEVAARVPMFITQTLGALTMAAGELAQAASLCDHAIGICTRYMTKAPLLIPARALVMGIKATIPALQSSITAAKSSVQQVGTTAQTGLTQAELAVKALFPMLDSAVAKVKSAAAGLAAMVKTLQGGMEQGLVRMDGMGTALETQIRQVGQQVDASAASFSKLPTQYAQRVPLDASLKTADQQLRQLSSSAFAPVESAVSQTKPRLEALVLDAEATLRPKLMSASAGLQTAVAQTQEHAGRFETRMSAVQAQLDGRQSGLSDLHRSALEAIDLERDRLAELFAIVLQRLQEVHGEVVATYELANPSPGSSDG